MKIKRKLIERLLVFLIGVPAVYALVFALPYYNHLALNIIVTAFSAIGAVEFAAMLNKKNILVTKACAFTLGALCPLTALLITSFGVTELIIPIALMSVILWAVLSLAFTKSADMDKVISRLAGFFTVMIYPGFFMFWIVRMSSFEHQLNAHWINSGAILLFLLIVIANDSFAWLFGNLFGKNNRGLIPASPNKSIAGYTGGLIGAVVVCIGAVKLFPFVFTYNELIEPSILMAVILGFFTAIAASLGDLAESAIKRSSDFKDSGNMILGRGGILDSIDSIAIAAPVYYSLFILFFL